ncbi:Rha family transcriptional regulator [Pseudomonas monteilii]
MHTAIDARNTPTGSTLTVQAQPSQLMSTREVAELTGKSHDNVLRDARSLASRGVLKSEETPYLHPQNGQSYPGFLLTQRDALVLVSTKGLTYLAEKNIAGAATISSTAAKRPTERT